MDGLSGRGLVRPSTAPSVRSSGVPPVPPRPCPALDMLQKKFAPMPSELRKEARLARGLPEPSGLPSPRAAKTASRARSPQRSSALRGGYLRSPSREAQEVLMETVVPIKLREGLELSSKVRERAAPALTYLAPRLCSWPRSHSRLAAILHRSQCRKLPPSTAQNLPPADSTRSLTLSRCQHLRRVSPSAGCQVASRHQAHRRGFARARWRLQPRLCHSPR